MDPIDFLDTYLTSYGPQKGLEKHPYGWRKDASELLADVLGVAPNTVKNWGNELNDCPDWVKTSLNREHKLRQIAAILESDKSD